MLLCLYRKCNAVFVYNGCDPFPVISYTYKEITRGYWYCQFTTVTVYLLILLYESRLKILHFSES